MTVLHVIYDSAVPSRRPMPTNYSLRPHPPAALKCSIGALNLKVESLSVQPFDLKFDLKT